MYCLRISIISGLLLPTLWSACFADFVQPNISPNQWNAGVETYYQSYQQPSVDLNQPGGFGSLVGNYTHNFTRFFLAADGRVSSGVYDSFSPIAGNAYDISETYLGARVRSGINISLLHGVLSPYVGLGAEYLINDAGDAPTSLGVGVYDSYTSCLYLPIGLQYAFMWQHDWFIAPGFEVAALLYQQVVSELSQEGPDYPNITNTQNKGYGLRGSVNFGRHPVGGGVGWSMGPFVRYFSADQSNIACGTANSNTVCISKPASERTQVGIALNLLW